MCPLPNAIGLLGGSFDPVHKGHTAIAESFIGSDLIDRLYIILTPAPPHKQDQSLTAYSHRLEMLKLAFEGYEEIEISDIEKQLPRPSYTVNTLRYFRKKYPGTDLYLCIGEDSLAEFTTWYQWEKILENCELLVAKRPNTELNEIKEEIMDKAHFIEHEQVEVSSSEIREQLPSEHSVMEQVPVRVADYIFEHKLYH